MEAKMVQREQNKYDAEQREKGHQTADPQKLGGRPGDVGLIRWLSRRKDWQIPEEAFTDLPAQTVAMAKNPEFPPLVRLSASRLVGEFHKQNMEHDAKQVDLELEVVRATRPAIPETGNPETGKLPDSGMIDGRPRLHLPPSPAELAAMAEEMRRLGMLAAEPQADPDAPLLSE